MDDISVILANHQGLGSVRLCGCNTIHLSIGPVTVAVAPEAFAQAATMIRKAMEQLQMIIEARDSGLTAANSAVSDIRWTH